MERTAEHKERIFTLSFIGIMMAELSLKLCNYMQGTLLPLYIIEKGYSNKVAGLTSTAYMLASLLLRPVSGRMADNRGRYVVALFGAVLYCAATGLYFFAIPVTFLIIMRAIQGAGFSFDGTGIYALATDHIPESRMAEGIGYLGLAQTSATALAPLIAITLKNSFGYRAAFMVIFMLSSMVLIILMLLRFLNRRNVNPKKTGPGTRVPAAEDTAVKATLLSKIIDKNALKPALLILLILFASSTINIFLTPHATLGGISNPGLFFVVQASMVFIARLTMSKVRQRVGITALLVSGMLLIFAGLIGLVFRLSLPLLLVCGSCYGLGIGVMQPQLSALAVLSAGKENRGMANATFFMMMDIGTAASGFVFGAIADAAGYTSIYSIAAFIALCTLLLFLQMRKRGFAA